MGKKLRQVPARAARRLTRTARAGYAPLRHIERPAHIEPAAIDMVPTYTGPAIELEPAPIPVTAPAGSFWDTTPELEAWMAAHHDPKWKPWAYHAPRASKPRKMSQAALKAHTAEWNAACEQARA